MTEGYGHIIPLHHDACGVAAPLPIPASRRLGGTFVSSLRHRRAFAEVLVPGLDRAAELERQRLALAVHGLAGLDADPAFGNAVFLDIVPDHALEADADAALQLVGIEMRAARVDRQMIGRDVGTGGNG